MRRKIITTIDSILNLFVDYTSKTGDIPYDVRAVTLQINPNEKGKFRIVAESDSWPHGLPPLVIRFDNRRVYEV